MVARLIVALSMLALQLAAGGPARAEMFRVALPDGTVTFTDAPVQRGLQPLRVTALGVIARDSADSTVGADVWSRERTALAARPGARTPPESAPARRTPIAPSARQLLPRDLHSLIREAAARHGLPERLISVVIAVESGFNPRAVSRAGAGGLMQLMPRTAATLGVRDVFDPAENIDGGVRHLRALLDRLGNNLPLALAAYNAGEQAVAQHGGIPPYPETRDYVARILRFLDGR